MAKFSSSFLASFKIGDNINYNLEVIKTLYSAQLQLDRSEKHLLEKPITVLLVSICEALIYDFIKRSQWFVREGVKGLPSTSLETLRTGDSWSMDKKIKLFKELNILQTKDAQVYDYLNKLSKLRNRIHIQNEKQNFEIDEVRAFTKARRIEAEKMVELLIRKIGGLYPRPPHIKESAFVEDFDLPWDSHF